MGTEANLTQKGRGRPKGSPNKLGKEAKEVIAAAADGLGGLDRMIEWAKSDPQNERAFWASIYPKLLPLTVHGAGDEGEHLIRSIERRIVKP
jgi:hypothetical protein